VKFGIQPLEYPIESTRPEHLANKLLVLMRELNTGDRDVQEMSAALRLPVGFVENISNTLDSKVPTYTTAYAHSKLDRWQRQRRPPYRNTNTFPGHSRNLNKLWDEFGSADLRSRGMTINRGTVERFPIVKSMQAKIRGAL
jgi:hypothetical protein